MDKIPVKVSETPAVQIRPAPFLNLSYTCFSGAQFLYDFDINCADNSPKGPVKGTVTHL